MNICLCVLCVSVCTRVLFASSLGYTRKYVYTYTSMVAVPPNPRAQYGVSSGKRPTNHHHHHHPQNYKTTKTACRPRRPTSSWT
jgi:hypothetical protein